MATVRLRASPSDPYKLHSLVSSAFRLLHAIFQLEPLSEVFQDLVTFPASKSQGWSGTVCDCMPGDLNS